MATLYTVSFKRTVLATLIGLCLSRYAFALQELSDDGLSATTGEGIAILPTNTYMILRAAGPNETQNALLTDRTKDTGYIHYLPVGGLTSIVQDTNKDGYVSDGVTAIGGSVRPVDHSVGKADLYLYGLALSKNANNDVNSRFDSGLTGLIANAAIASWGSAQNPWIFKTTTAKNVPNFSAANCTGASDLSCQITYLNLEAPLYDITRPTTAEAGADAYNLKLAFWTDAFVRDQSKAEGSVDQFNLGENFGTTAAGRANRLRLQAIWNGFSINGSNLQMFQTLNGATNTKGMSSFYNNTLGLAGVLRFNSGDGANLKATMTDTTTSSIGTTSAWTTISNGQDTTFGTSKTASTGNCGNASTGNFTATAGSAGCKYIVQNQKRTDTQTRTRTWTAPNVQGVLRLSTRETADTDRLATPATGGASPNFASNEGLYIYNLNANLVLGSLYQPVILGSDGKNLSLEIARIPNKPEIYKKIYTDYSGTDATYLGSTCNIYQCGTSDIANYQGGSPRTDYSASALSNKKLATHSSISIGTVYSPDGGKTLLAFKGDTSNDAIGISFGGPLQNNTLTTTTSNTAIQVRYAERAMSTSTWLQSSRCTGTNIWGTCNSTSDTTGYLYQWQYDNGTSLVNSANGWTATPTSAASCNGGSGSCNNVSGTTPIYGTVANRTWSDTNLNGGAWKSTSSAAVNAFIGASNGTTGYVIPATNTAPIPNVASPSPSTNFGSAVIDGLLIQHMKITTTGL